MRADIQKLGRNDLLDNKACNIIVSKQFGEKI